MSWGTWIIGALVLAALASAVYRVIKNMRGGGCASGCDGCAGCDHAKSGYRKK